MARLPALMNEIFLRLERAETRIVGADGNAIPAAVMVRVVSDAVEYVRAVVERELEAPSRDGPPCEAACSLRTSVDDSQHATTCDEIDVLDFFMKMYLAEVERRYVDVSSYALALLSQVRCGQPGVADSSIFSTERGLAKVGRLVVLAGSISDAATSDEFRAVLDAFADPVGSFITKREDRWHVTINAYLGVSGGMESVGPEENIHLGLALPVGLEISHGSRSRCCSIAFLVSPIALGVIADYQLGGEPPVHDVTWRQLLAPSLFVILDFFPHTPVSFGIGAQYAPMMRETSDGLVDAVRLSVMAAVDVTLFRIW